MDSGVGMHLPTVSRHLRYIVKVADNTVGHKLSMAKTLVKTEISSYRNSASTCLDSTAIALGLTTRGSGQCTGADGVA